jgi:hypothetical protein
MPERSRKKKLAAINELAAVIVQEATEDGEQTKPEREKNPAAVALGGLGG